MQQQVHGAVEVLQVLGVAGEPSLAGGALHVDVLVHALDVADRGVDAGGDGVDLHLNGDHSGIQRGEALSCAVLVVSAGGQNRTKGVMVKGLLKS